VALGQVIDVLETAVRCGAQVKNDKDPRKVLCTCPICGETGGHLSIDTGQQMFHCFKCSASGKGGLQFYMQYSGIGDWQEAIKELRGMTGINYAEPKEAPPATDLAAPVDVRDRTYRAFLQKLTLSDAHRQNLLDRGLPEDALVYKSLPTEAKTRWRICKELLKEGITLEHVPGFFQRKSSYGLYWDFHCPGPGFFIPMLDAQGRIQGMQVRLDEGKGKNKDDRYRWFSSAQLPGGAGSGSPVHVPLSRQSKRVWVTEGPIKAEIASRLLNRPFVAVAGVGSYRNVKSVLQELGAQQVIVAYDQDDKEKTRANVDHALENLALELLSDFDVWAAVWAGADGKGIDDFLWGLVQSSKEIGEGEQGGFTFQKLTAERPEAEAEPEPADQPDVEAPITNAPITTPEAVQERLEQIIREAAESVRQHKEDSAWKKVGGLLVGLIKGR